jgi:hypothetical protein
MATNSPRHGYERKRSQLKTKTMGQKALDETQSQDWRIYGSEESWKVQVGSSGKERQTAMPA